MLTILSVQWEVMVLMMRMTKLAETHFLDCNHSDLFRWFSRLLVILDLLATAVATKRKIAQMTMDTEPFSFLCWTKRQ